jgi:beta-xylosidase
MDRIEMQNTVVRGLLAYMKAEGLSKIVVTGEQIQELNAVALNSPDRTVLLVDADANDGGCTLERMTMAEAQERRKRRDEEQALKAGLITGERA